MSKSKAPVARKPFWIAVAVAGVFTIILSFPKRKAAEPESKFENPEERAEELISGLLVRLGSDSADAPPPPREVGGPADPARDLFSVRPVAPVRPKPKAGSPRGDGMPALPVLGGLLVDGGQRLAILNGKAAGEGDRIDGYRVQKIEDDGVVLEWRGQTKRVRWKD